MEPGREIVRPRTLAATLRAMNKEDEFIDMVEALPDPADRMRVYGDMYYEQPKLPVQLYLFALESMQVDSLDVIVKWLRDLENPSASSSKCSCSCWGKRLRRK